ncbi:MAG: efflux RND transporter permease subunit [Bacteroidia bacterium]|nr:efflux RND transporter permease subunit [Bacteroidia bacterium]
MSNIKEVIKEFKLTTWAVNNKISVYVIIGILLIVGYSSYTSMPKESFPEIKQPIVYINTAYPGNSPIDMENLVTRPIEKEVNTITGLKKLTSTSIQDFSVIIAEFEFTVNGEKATQEVKDAIDKAKMDLPNDLPADPSVMEMDFSEFPVMNVNVSGDYSEDKLKEYAEYLQDEIESLSEVSSVDLSGLSEEEVEISIDRVKMEALELSLNDVEQAIAGENVTMSGGDIKSIEGSDITRRNIRIDGEFKDYREIENVIVKSEFQNIVYLRDIGEVSFGPKEATSYARLNGEPVVTLDIMKKSGGNLIAAAEKIQEIVKTAKQDILPKDLEVIITNDQSKMTKNMVNNLENSIILGVLLVVGVLIFFLGVRNSLFVGIAIPLSMLMGIAILNYSGTSLNMMVLFSLILALGMLVDNGIVIVENVYRLYSERGKTKDRSSIEGTGEVATAIIASTATTVAAFVPLMFWPSLMGEFFKYLPITLIIVLSSSLFVALVVNPVLTSDWIKIGNNEKSKVGKFWVRNLIILIIAALLYFAQFNFLGGLFVAAILISVSNRYYLTPVGNWFMNKIMPKIEESYAQFVRFALGGWKPIFFLIGMIVFFILTMGFFMAKTPPIVFFPDSQPNYVNIYIETPLGTDIEKTNKIAKKLEARIKPAIAKDSAIVEAVLAQVGEKTADPNEGPQSGSSPNKARITVSFFEYEKRVFLSETTTSEIMQSIKEACADFPEAKLTFAKDAMGPPVGKPISLEVKGEDYLTLIGEVEKIKKKMEDANLKGVDQLKTDLELGKPVLEVSINQEAARRFSLSTMQIAGTIRTALLGKEISKYKEGEEDYKIQLRFKDDYRYNLENLLNTRITFRNMATGQISQVPISAVADVSYNSTYGSVKRKDMDRVITIFSEVDEGANANDLVAQYKALLADHEIKSGYEFKFGGEQAEQEESMAFLGGAMLLAVFLIFLIIVTQFNSVAGPFIIMLSVFFSTIGVFLGFTLTQTTFSVMMTGIGIISLAGIVVNNAIVLIDYTNLLRQRKRAELGVDKKSTLAKTDIIESIVEAGKTRLRPVLLTAITTVLGLFPLAIGLNINFGRLLREGNPELYWGGQNADFWGPMAWAVIYGLIFATFLTLVIVPVMYYLSDRITLWLKKVTGKNVSVASETT